jgi:hypothetical protein
VVVDGGEWRLGVLGWWWWRGKKGLMGLLMDLVVIQKVGWSLLDAEGDTGPVATLVRGIVSPFG